METLHGKPVRVTTPGGEPVALGRFQVDTTPGFDTGQRIELHFATDTLSCRLRIPQAKIAAIKATWDGERFTYALPSDSVWRDSSPGSPAA